MKRNFFQKSLLFLLLFLSFHISLQAQSLYTRATRARTPLMARAILNNQQIPGNVILTLIARVSLWPKDNVDLLHEKTSILIPEKYVVNLAGKYGNMDQNKKKFQEPLTPQDLLKWALKWETKNKNCLQPWLKWIEPSSTMTREEFLYQWKQMGGEDLPSGSLDKIFDR